MADEVCPNLGPLIFFFFIFQVYVFELKNKELFGLAFIDSQIYIHQVSFWLL